MDSARKLARASVVVMRTATHENKTRTSVFADAQPALTPGAVDTALLTVVGADHPSASVHGEAKPCCAQEQCRGQRFAPQHGEGDCLEDLGEIGKQRQRWSLSLAQATAPASQLC